MRHNKVMRFRIGALFGWGIVIYAVMFLLWSVFVTYGFVEGIAPRILGLIVLVILAVLAGRSLKAHVWQDIIPYSICWGLIMAIFDVVMSVPFAGWQIFLDWNVWFGYGVVVFAPLLVLYPRFGNFSSSSSSV